MGENNTLPDPLSNEPHKTVKSYFAETCVKTQESVYDWKIRNLSHSYLKESECFSSPTFKTEVEDDTLEWWLSFYPNGYGDTSENHTSLILSKSEESDPSETERTVYAKFSILVHNEGCFKEEVQHEDYTIFGGDDEDSENFVIYQFFEKKIMDRFLHNGNLTIRCRLYAYLGTVESNISVTPVTHVEKKTALDNRIRELEDFGKLYESEKFSDLTLIVGEEKFFAHKNVLSCRSRVFAAMFEYDMKENQENSVVIVDVESEVMKEVLRFVYSAKVENLESLAHKLLAAADKYELIGLKEMCEDALIDKLSDKTVGEILLLADRHDTQKLRAATLEFVMIHANALATLDSFNSAIKSLSPLLVSTVIKTLMLKM